MPTWFHRTTRQQNELYQKGRGLFPDKKKIVTYCDGYKRRSKHQDWLAVDIVILVNGKIRWSHPGYKLLGKYWTDRGRLKNVV